MISSYVDQRGQYDFHLAVHSVNKITNLPLELVLYCFSFCDIHTLCVLLSTSKSLYCICNNSLLWKPFLLKFKISVPETCSNLRELFYDTMNKRLSLVNEQLDDATKSFSELKERLINRASKLREVSEDSRVFNCMLLEQKEMKDSAERKKFREFDHLSEFTTTTRSGDIETDKKVEETIHFLRAETAKNDQMRSELLKWHKEMIALLHNSPKTNLVSFSSTANPPPTYFSSLSQDNSFPEIHSTRKAQNLTDLQRYREGNFSYSKKLALFDMFELRLVSLVLRPSMELSIVLKRGIRTFGELQTLLYVMPFESSERLQKRWEAIQKILPSLTEYYDLKFNAESLHVIETTEGPFTHHSSSTLAPQSRIEKENNSILFQMRRLLRLSDRELEREAGLDALIY